MALEWLWGAYRLAINKPWGGFGVALGGPGRVSPPEALHLSITPTYAFDTGFVCHARGWDHLRAEDCGPLWEHLVLDTLLSVEDPAKVLFWRDHQQREVDFVVPRGRKAVDAYECKWSALQAELANLRAFRQVYPEGRNYLVVPQPTAAQTLRLEGLVVQVVSPTDLVP